VFSDYKIQFSIIVFFFQSQGEFMAQVETETIKVFLPQYLFILFVSFCCLKYNVTNK